MNKFDSHVILYEKYLLNVSLRFTKFLKKGRDFETHSIIKPSRKFQRFRLIGYLSKMNTVMDYNEYVAEYRKGLKMGFRDE